MKSSKGGADLLTTLLKVSIKCSIQGSISLSCLLAAFTSADPASVKIQLSCQYLFGLLGAAHVKAVHKILMKLTPGPSFINVVRTAFTLLTNPTLKTSKKNSFCN